MAPPVNLITIAVAAGIGICTVLYHLYIHFSKEEPFRNHLPLPSNNSKSLSYLSSPTLPKRRSQPSKCQVSSPDSTPQEVMPSTSNSGARRRETGTVKNCYICTNLLGTDTIGLGCGHTFDKECYDIVEQMWKMFGVNSKCPECITQSLFK